MQPIGRLAITGVPGWLTEVLVSSLLADPLPGQAVLRCMILPGTRLPAGVFSEAAAAGKIEIVEADLRDPAALAAALAGSDTVLHAAGVLHVKRVEEFYHVNTAGTLALARAASAAGCRRFVNISTNAAAGRSSARERLLTEEDAPRPLNAYGRSKWQAEQGLSALGGDMEMVHLRPCMFYGPPVPARHVDIYRRLLHGWMPMVGSGDYARSVVHVDNLVQVCRLALTHPAAAGQTFFAADPEVHTTRSIVEAMARALGARPRYLRLPAISAQMAYFGDSLLEHLGIYWQALHLVGEADWHVGVSVAKAQRLLQYQPKHGLADGMAAAAAWCRTRGLL